MLLTPPVLSLRERGPFLSCDRRRWQHFEPDELMEPEIPVPTINVLIQVRGFSPEDHYGT